MAYEQKTVLLVEDEALIAMTIRKELERLGYTVHYAGNGEKAIRSVIDDSLPIDLILMDINLGPGIDGTQAAERIYRHKDIPIVFLSSHTEPEIVERTEKVTSYGYIVKNSSVTVLDASIKMALKLYRANRACSESEQKFRMLAEQSPSMIFINKNGRIVYANAICESILGYSRDELYSPQFDFRVLIAPDSRERIEAYFRTHRSKENTPPYEYGLITKSGARIEAINSPALISYEGESAILGVVTDITDRKRAEEALILQRNTYEHILEQSLAGYWDWRIPEGREYLSSSFKRMFGYDDDELENTPESWQRIIYEEDLSRVQETFKKHVETRGLHPYYNEVRYHHKDGSTIWVICTGKVIEWDHGNQPVRMVGCHIDITALKRAEDEIQKQLTEKEALLVDVHHRVKNNIANIEAFLSLQAESSPNREVRTILHESISRFQSMRVLYERMLLSKDYREVEMKHYIENLVASIRAVFPEKEHVFFHTMISDFTLATRQAISIGIIINELISNIFKHAFKDQGSGTVDISLEKCGAQIILTVQDNGVGIDEPSRLDTSPGFGLQIIRMLVEQQNGEFTVQKGKGTKSVIRLEQCG